jgi:hypothetical protein
MGYMIEIHESKIEKLSELAEKMLKYGGKLMTCIEELEEEDGMSERNEGGYGRYKMRGGSSRSMMGNRGGYSNYREEDEDWDDDEMEDMNERRGRRRRRDSRGRYM